MKHIFKSNKYIILLIISSFLIVSCGEKKMSMQMKMNRINFLVKNKKYDKAVEFANNAFQDEVGEDRGRMLMRASRLNYQRYLDTNRKTFLKTAVKLLKTIIKEKLPQRPSAIYELAGMYKNRKDEGSIDIALKYLKRASKEVLPDQNKAGRYYMEVISIHMKRGDYVKTMKACDYILRNYDKFNQRQRVKDIKEHARTELVSRGFLF